MLSVSTVERMPMLTHEYTPISEDEYLRLEAQSPIKYE